MATATWPTREIKAELNKLFFIKDRLELRLPDTHEQAVRMRNLLRDMPNAPVSDNQLARLVDLDESINALDPAWVIGQGGTPKDREHASNKITKLQSIFDRLTAEATKDVDLLAMFTKGNRPSAEDVNEAELVFEQ